MPTVSVIMNCHNCSRFLAQALDSVYCQTFKDYEIIFWDNKSTDESGEIASSYGAPLKYFYGDEFLPLGAARNAAIEQAKGKYIAFLDCDDIWLPEKLEKQVNLLESNQELGMVYSDCIIINAEGNLTDTSYFKSVMPIRGNIFKQLFHYNFIAMLTVVIKAEALNKVGLFNPKYEIDEEYDLWLRIAEQYPVDFIDRPLAKFRLHGGSAYQKNTILAYQEALQIIESWMKKKPAIKRVFGHLLRLRKGFFYFLAALKYLARHPDGKTMKQFIRFKKYWLTGRA